MRRLGQDLVKSRKERIHLRQRRRDEHPHFFAGGLQRLGEGKAAPERVSIGIFVAEDQDLLVGLDQLLDLVVDGRRPLGGGYDSPSAASPLASGSTSFSSSE